MPKRKKRSYEDIKRLAAEVPRNAEGKRIRPSDAAFVDNYIRADGNITEAMRLTRPELVGKMSDKHIHRKGLFYLAKPHVRRAIEDIHQILLDQLQPSIERLADLRDNSESDLVKMNSAKTLVDQYQAVLNRAQKYVQGEALQQQAESITNNILIANLSDDEILRRIQSIKSKGAGGAVSGAGEAEVQERPDPSDGEVPGV